MTRMGLGLWLGSGTPVALWTPSDEGTVRLWHDGDLGLTEAKGTIDDDLSTWTDTGLTSVTGGQADPLGGSAAFLLTEDSSTGFHYVVGQSTGLATGTMTFSAYVKDPGSGRAYALVYFTGITAGVYIDMSDGSVAGTTGTLIDSSSVDAGGGWYLVTIVATATAATEDCAVWATTGTGSPSYSGDGRAALLVYVAEETIQLRASAWDDQAGVIPVRQNVVNSQPMIATSGGVAGTATEYLESYGSLSELKFLHTEATFFWCGEQGAGASGYLLTTCSNSNSYVGIVIYKYISAATVVAIRNGGAPAYFASGGSAFSGPTTLCVAFDGTSLQIRVNGVEVATQPLQQAISAVDCSAQLDASHPTSRFYGTTRERIAYDSKLSVPAIERVEAYLAARWL